MKRIAIILLLLILLFNLQAIGGEVHADNGITFDLNMTVDPSGSGTTDPAVGTHTYAENSVITITATSATSYTFNHWTGDVSTPDSASTTVTMDGDKTVTAHFVRIGDTTTVGILSLVPTIECIGVVVNYTGDNNQNNSALLQYRQSGDAWKTAPEMYADRAKQQYRGSIFWLTTNTDYEVKVTFIDPDSGGSVTATTKTRNDNPPSNGNTYYVATTGSDSDPGTLSQPFKTIQKAADIVSAGDTVYVRAGTYNEQVEITTSGAINNYITFRPYENENAILDGQGTLSSLFVITGDYIRIKGFTIKKSSNGSAVLISGADGVIVEDNAIEDPDIRGTGTQGGIRLDFGASNALLQRNTISVNAGPIGGDGRGIIFGIVYWKPGWGHVIRNNMMSGGVSFRDGFGGGPEDTPEYMNNLDFYNNVIRGTQDDSIQPEGGNVNVRIWNNRIENCFVGIAVCPSLQGPAYIFRNTIIHSTEAAFKIGDNSYGRIYIYHNTYYTTAAADGYKQTNPDLGNIVSRNNIIHAGRYTVELTTSSNGSSHDFDYDNLYSTDSGHFVKWNGIKYSSIGTFHYTTGQEPNGISSDSEFVDPEVNDLALQPTSTCINMGVVLPGFNDASSPWPYQGSAPDLGAYEATESAATQPPSITNDGATSVNATIAILNGTIIDDGGGSCLYRFEYDTEPGEPYAHNTGWIGIKTTGQSFSSNISGLSPETKYYFRAQAKNSAGTSSSSENITIFVLTSVISGITAEVKGDVIPGATVKLYLDGALQSTTTSSPDGQYELTATEIDEYMIVVSAAGFKKETQAVSITSLGDDYILDFIGESGLIPQAPTLSYVLNCANHWLFPPVGHPELALSMSKVLAVANAYLYH